MLTVMPCKLDYAYNTEYIIGSGVRPITEYNYYYYLMIDAHVPKVFLENVLIVLSYLPTPYWRVRTLLTILNLTRTLYVKDRLLGKNINSRLLTDHSVSTVFMTSPKSLNELSLVARS